MEYLNKEFIKEAVKKQEEIIKKLASQGYNYLVIKNEIIMEESIFKCSTKYQGLFSLEGLEYLESEGYEIRSLDKVKEYLSQNSH